MRAKESIIHSHPDVSRIVITVLAQLAVGSMVASCAHQASGPCTRGPSSCRAPGSEGATEDALAHFRAALAIDPGYSEARLATAEALLRLGRLQDARWELAKLCEADHTTPRGTPPTLWCSRDSTGSVRRRWRYDEPCRSIEIFPPRTGLGPRSCGAVGTRPAPRPKCGWS